MRKNSTASKGKPPKSRTTTKADPIAKAALVEVNSPSAGGVKGKVKTVRIDARIPSHVKEIVQYAASLQGRSQTDFMVTAIHEAAQRVIAESSVIRLCLEDQRELAAALREDVPVSSDKGLGRLRRAAHDHGKKVDSR